MNKFKRNNCILTDKNDIELIYSFKNFPIYVGCVESDFQNDIFSDMNWGISKSSGIIQLIDLLDPNVLYKQHHNSGTIGNIWREHHEKFFQLIKKHGFKNILEIGGGSGVLAKKFLKDKLDVNYTIIEPSEQAKIDGIEIVTGLFENFKFNKKFDTIIHSHVLEHVYSPREFLLKINSLLDNGDRQYISFPNMQHWLDKGFTNTLMFEHTYYIDGNIIDILLNKTGFKIVEKIVEPHSIFVCCEKSDDVKNVNYNFNYIEDMFFRYIDNLKKDIFDLKEKIKDNKFYLFGGHIFSQTLINLGLPENQIISILDNDPNKQNMRLYGTNLMVESPTCLINELNPLIVLRGGVYSDEIKKSIISINPTSVFL